jgi:hypothetical protein
MSMQLNLYEGKKRRDEGMSLAETKAEVDNPGWAEAAIDFVREYAKRNAVFLTEDVRFAAQGIPELKCKNPKAWGGIMKKAGGKLQIVFADGYQSVRNFKAHATPATRWKSLVYQYRK